MSKDKIVKTAMMVTLMLAGAGPAAGDAIGPGKPDCPPGTTGDSDHYGSYCAAGTCQNVAACAPKQRCQAHALCVQQVVYHSPRGDTHRARAMGTCSKTRPCKAPAKCVVARRCVPENTPLPDITRETAPVSKVTPGGGAPQKQGCGSCVVGPGSPGAGGGVIGLLLMALLVLRRRRR